MVSSENLVSKRIKNLLKEKYDISDDGLMQVIKDRSDERVYIRVYEVNDLRDMFYQRSKEVALEEFLSEVSADQEIVDETYRATAEEFVYGLTDFTNEYFISYPVARLINEDLTITYKDFERKTGILQSRMSNWKSRDKKIRELPISFIQGIKLVSSFSYDEIMEKLLSYEAEYEQLRIKMNHDLNVVPSGSYGFVVKDSKDFELANILIDGTVSYYYDDMSEELKENIDEIAARIEAEESGKG